MQYFTIQELTHSNTAIARNINNTPPQECLDNLIALVDNLLDPIRKMWGKPINVTSGYRCKELNAVVGGVSNSEHTKGCAVDIVVGNHSDNKKLFDMIRNSDLKWTQLISERTFYGGCQWVHISYDRNNLKRQVLKL